MALLSVTVCKPLLFGPKPDAGDIPVLLGSVVDLGQLGMDVGRCRNGHGIPARRWRLRVSHHPEHILEGGLTSRGDPIKHLPGALVERTSSATSCLEAVSHERAL